MFSNYVFHDSQKRPKRQNHDFPSENTKQKKTQSRTCHFSSEKNVKKMCVVGSPPCSYPRFRKITKNQRKTPSRIFRKTLILEVKRKTFEKNAKFHAVFSEERWSKKHPKKCHLCLGWRFEKSWVPPHNANFEKCHFWPF